MCRFESSWGGGQSGQLSFLSIIETTNPYLLGLLWKSNESIDVKAPSVVPDTQQMFSKLFLILNQKSETYVWPLSRSKIKLRRERRPFTLAGPDWVQLCSVHGLSSEMHHLTTELSLH